MDEESSSDAPGEPSGAGGDASQVLHCGETDSGISVSSKLDKEEQNAITSPSSSAMSKGKTSSGSNGSGHTLSGAEGEKAGTMGNKCKSTGEEEMDAVNASYAKQTTPSPKVDKHGEGDGLVEENMCVDPDDVVLSLDQVVQRGVSPPTRQDFVQVSTSLSPTASSSQHGEESSPRGNRSKAPACKSSASSGTVECGEPSGLGAASNDSLEDGGSEGEESKAVAPEDLSSLSEDVSDSDDDDEEEGAGVVNARLLTARQRGILQRRRQIAHGVGRRRQLSSLFESLAGDPHSDHDDDDDDDDDGSGRDDGNARTEKESDEEEIEHMIQGVVNKPKPSPNWFALRELRQREYCSADRLASSWFRDRVQSSLHMVRKLVTVERMTAHEGCVNALSFNRIGTLLASGSDDLDIVLWNWQKARPSVSYNSGHRSNVFQAKFMPFSGDCHVISCARDGQVRLAELNSSGVCRATRKLAQHRAAAHKLALELDSAHVFLSCGEDALVYLFDLRQDKPHKLVTAKENDKKVPLYSIHCNPTDSNQFCVGGRDHYIRVYDKRKISEHADGGVLKKLCPHHLVTSDLKANVTCACYNYNGAEILGTYNDEDIYLFDNTMSDGANYVHKYEGHRNSATVKGVNFYGPKSEFIVSGSDCGHVYFWDKQTEAIINFQTGDDTGVINALEPHPTLPVLATSGLDHDVKLWMPMVAEPNVNWTMLKKVMRKNQIERNLERSTSEPEIGGQMLWFIMNHFRNTARRRMREEGQELSSSDDEEDNTNSDDSETNQMQCAQS
ncbi:hypothetical protein EGW08_006198 [Elysia chlorotica]|uniref:Uncharacterized protein n=1 Tax=Elysia chlorotica TaxID=188477 RepID=A0A3S1BKQ2_ELYCH|nr:hypothetical protein EGW08_006198 [Elysia chlorotica]